MKLIHMYAIKQIIREIKEKSQLNENTVELAFSLNHETHEN